MWKTIIADLGSLSQAATAIVSALALLVSVFTLIILYCNLGQFWRQNALTQALNRPLCGIKDVLVNVYSVPPNPTDVIGIDAVIVNSGNDYARDVTLTYEIYALNSIEHTKTPLAVKKAGTDDGKWMLLPRHEVRTFLMYIQKTDFDRAVLGYNKVAILELALEYYNMDNKKMRFTCLYSISRLLTNQDMKVYEVSLRESKLTEP